jgi:hypothetical protein
MMELDEQCKDAVITVMNEIELGKCLSLRLFLMCVASRPAFPTDPGIDHLCKNSTKNIN